MRGSVSMALAYNQFARSDQTQDRGSAIMITSVITVIFFSTLVFGMLNKPLLRFLSPLSRNSYYPEPSSPGKSMTLPLLIKIQDSDDPMAGNLSHKSTLRMLFTTPTRTVHFYWRKFDDACMRPIFGGGGETQQGE